MVKVTLGGIAALVLAGAVSWRVVVIPPWIETDARAASVDFRKTAYNLGVASEDLKSITAALADKRGGIERTLRNINIVTAQLGRTSNVARLAASEQRQYFATMSQESASAIREVRAAAAKAGDLIESANANLNEGTLPALTADLKRLDASLESLTKDSHLAITAATGAMEQASAVLADPNITAATKSLSGAAAGMNTSAANVAEATGYVRDALRPSKPSFWGAVVHNVLPSVLSPLVTLFLHQRVDVRNTVKTEAK